MVLPLKTQVLYGSLVGVGLDPYLTLGVAVRYDVRDARVIDLVCSAPGLVTGFPGDVAVGVGELARGAEVVGVVVVNLRGTRRSFGLLGSNVLESSRDAFLQWYYIVGPEFGVLLLQTCQVEVGPAHVVGVITLSHTYGILHETHPVATCAFEFHRHAVAVGVQEPAIAMEIEHALQRQTESVGPSDDQD